MSKSFGGVQETVAKVGTKISTGIHEVKIKTVEVLDIKGKDGKPDWKKGNVIFECVKTIEGRDSVGKSIDYQITIPLEWDKVEPGNNGKNTLSNGEKLGKRLIHIFNKISTSDKKDTVTAAIQKLDLSSITTLIAGLKKIVEGRTIRLKVVADKDRKWPIIPAYYAGYAECIDVNPTELRYDEATEGTLTSPKGAEDTSLEAPTTTEGDESDLPF